MLIYGMHERCPNDVMQDGWVLYLAEMGDNDSPHPGIDLSDESRARMIRLQWRWGSSGGCFPPEGDPDRFDRWVARCLSCVTNTPDCHVWIVGNEPNHSQEGLHSPPYTALNYMAVRAGIRVIPGHEDDLVLFPPIAPWNVESGIDWIEYFVVSIAFADEIDGFAIHTYSRGPDPSTITADTYMDAPYNYLHNGFQTYRDWMNAIPERYRGRPVHITETNQNGPWEDEITGWVQMAYAEINGWNVANPDRPIHSLILYRWPKYDSYFIDGLTGVIADFLLAQAHKYAVEDGQQPDPDPDPGDDMSNLLSNGSCENGFRLIEDQWGVPQSSINVAHDWFPWSSPNDPKLPEYKPANDAANTYPDRVYQGDGGRQAQQWFWASEKGMGGIYQRVSGVAVGRKVRFSLWMEHWSSSEEVNKPPNGRMHARIGIDPYGGTNPESRDIIWGQPVQDIWEYSALLVEATTMSNRVTVWVWTLAEWPMLHNDVYVDAMQLVYTDDPPVDPDPDPDPEPGECDLTNLYLAHAETHRLLAEAHRKAKLKFLELAND